MKKILRFLLSLILVISLSLQMCTLPARAEFIDLKRSGVSFNFKPGNWVSFYTKIPGAKDYQKFYAKITKYKRTEYPAKKTTGSSSSTSDPGTISIRMVVQVQIPKKISKKVAKKLLKSRLDYIDFIDVCVVDKKTGENLNTSESSEEGNYHGVYVEEGNWKGLKPQRITWVDGTDYQYYISYVKPITVRFPSNYKRTCIGICGSITSSHRKMLDWNEGFTEGYTVFSDTAHIKRGNKALTAKLSHFMNLK